MCGGEEGGEGKSFGNADGWVCVCRYSCACGCVDLC